MIKHFVVYGFLLLASLHCEHVNLSPEHTHPRRIHASIG